MRETPELRASADRVRRWNNGELAKKIWPRDAITSTETKRSMDLAALAGAYLDLAEETITESLQARTNNSTGPMCIDCGEPYTGSGIDIALPDDQIVEYQGSSLLVIKQELADQLEGITIDVEDAEEG